MNVLSLFDGMSCGQIALERAGIEYDNYFASEIDKWAIQITQKNYPDTIQLGDVKNWKDWDLPEIDLIMGGSPCQGFSRSGNKLNFNDQRSALFFDFVDILDSKKPRWWLLENVKMKKEWQDIINQHLYGTLPIEINSAKVSAQLRERLYWTNIPNIVQPMNQGIYLFNVLEEGFVDRKKSYCIDANYFKGGNPKQYFEKCRRQLVFSNKPFRVGSDNNINGNDFLKRIYAPWGKSPTLTSITGGNQYRKIALDEYYDRKLTPVECERLQTVPDNYTEGVSNTQRYRMLGNGWTVDVIAHIFKGINHE